MLWGTANLFANPRFMHGAATSPEPKVFAYAAAQVKKAIEVTKELGGQNYVFWGGREGYETLLNTDMKLELENIGPLPPHGGRLRQGDRLHGAVPHRAQAHGAHQAPVRLRRGGLLRLPQGVRPPALLQAQHRDEPRDPGRPHDPARAPLRAGPRHPGLGRRQPGRRNARLGHRPVPDEPLHHHADDVRSAQERRASYGRPQLRRKGAKGLVQGRGHRHSAHRGHGLLRPRAPTPPLA